MAVLHSVYLTVMPLLTDYLFLTFAKPWHTGQVLCSGRHAAWV